MITGILTSGAALGPAALAQSLLANNLANATTTGFRQDRVSFEQRLPTGEPGVTTSLPGSAPDLATALDRSVGAYDVTDRPLDLAIQGDGYFVVETPEGERYTRAGNFSLGPDGALTTAQGYPLLCDGGPIKITQAETLRVAPSGEIRSGDQSLGRLRIVTFPADTVLTRSGASLLSTEGESQTAADARVLQGVLEGPNVEPLQALVDMVTLLRHFEMNQKALQVQDESLGALLAWVRG